MASIGLCVARSSLNQQELKPCILPVSLNRGTAPITARIRASKKSKCDHGDCRKLKDATKKFLALARHLLSFYPGTHAKGDAAAKKGKGKK